MSEIAHFINGQILSGNSTRRQDVFNPATGVADKAVIFATENDVDDAVNAASAAWPEWSKTETKRFRRSTFIRSLSSGSRFPKKSSQVKKVIFPDHYKYRKNDITKIIKKAKNINAQIITTEKDFIKMPKNYQNKIDYINIDMEINQSNNFMKFLKKKIND